MYFGHIVDRLLVRRYSTVLVDGSTAGVVGGDGRTYAVFAEPAEVVELCAQVDRSAEDVAEWIVGIHTNAGRRSGHELHESNRTGGAARAHVEVGFCLHDGRDEEWIDVVACRSIQDSIRDPVTLYHVAIIEAGIGIDDAVEVGGFSPARQEDAQ